VIAMPVWTQLVSLMDFCAVYYTTQLVRCTAFFFVLIGLVMLLRKTLFSGRTFLKGNLWALFLVIPFLGRLKLFYENEAVLKATWRITAVTTSWLWADRIYIAGIMAAAIRIFGKRLRCWLYIPIPMPGATKAGTLWLGNMAWKMKSFHVIPRN